MATSPIKRAVKTPGATETTTPDPAPTAETENTTGTVSEPVAADATTSDATTDPAPTVEASQALPDDYEEYLAWKNSRAKQTEEPKTTLAATTSTGAADSMPKRKRPVLGPQGWTQEEY